MKKYFVSLKNVVSAVSEMPEVRNTALAVGTGLITISGWIVADIQRRKIAEYETVDLHAWPSFEVSPGAYKRVEEGKTLKLRMYKIEPNRTFIQMTTDDDFPVEAKFCDETEIINE